LVHIQKVVPYKHKYSSTLSARSLKGDAIPYATWLYDTVFGIICVCQVSLLREVFRIAKLTFYSDLRRRAVSRLALPYTSSLLWITVFTHFYLHCFFIVIVTVFSYSALRPQVWLKLSVRRFSTQCRCTLSSTGCRFKSTWWTTVNGKRGDHCFNFHGRFTTALMS